MLSNYGLFFFPVEADVGKGIVASLSTGGGGEKNPSKTEFGWILVLKWEQKRERQHQQGKSLNKKHVQTVQQLC